MRTGAPYAYTEQTDYARESVYQGVEQSTDPKTIDCEHDSTDQRTRCAVEFADHEDNRRASQEMSAVR